MTKHLVDLYQAFVKGKGKQIETNYIGSQSTTNCDFMDGDEALPLTHLNVFDFFEDPSRKFDHLIGNDDV